MADRKRRNPSGPVSGSVKPGEVAPGDPRVPRSARTVILSPGNSPIPGNIPGDVASHLKRIQRQRAERAGQAPNMPGPGGITVEDLLAEEGASTTPDPGNRQATGSASTEGVGKSKSRLSKAQKERKARVAEAKEAKRTAIKSRTDFPRASTTQGDVQGESTTERMVRLGTHPESPITELDVDMSKLGMNPSSSYQVSSLPPPGFGRELFTVAPPELVKSLQERINSTSSAAIKNSLEARLASLHKTAADNRRKLVESGLAIPEEVKQETAAEETLMQASGLAAPRANDPRRVPRATRLGEPFVPSSTNPPQGVIPASTVSTTGTPQGHVVDIGMAGLTSAQIRQVENYQSYMAQIEKLMRMPNLGSSEATLPREWRTRQAVGSEIPRVKGDLLPGRFEVRRRLSTGDVVAPASVLSTIQSAARQRARAVIEENREIDVQKAAIEKDNENRAAVVDARRNDQAWIDRGGMEANAPLPVPQPAKVPGIPSGRSVAVPPVKMTDALKLPASKRKKVLEANELAQAEFAETPTGQAESPAQVKEQYNLPRGQAIPAPQSAKDVEMSALSSASDVVTWQVPRSLARPTRPTGLALAPGAMWGARGSALREAHELNDPRIASVQRRLYGQPVVPSVRKRAYGSPYVEQSHKESLSALSAAQNAVDRQIEGMSFGDIRDNKQNSNKLEELKAIRDTHKAAVDAHVALKAAQDAADAAPSEAQMNILSRRGLPRSGGTNVTTLGQYNRGKDDRTVPPPAPSAPTRPPVTGSDVLTALEGHLSAFAGGYTGTAGLNAIARSVEKDPRSAYAFMAAATRGAETSRRLVASSTVTPEQARPFGPPGKFSVEKGPIISISKDREGKDVPHRVMSEEQHVEEMGQVRDAISRTSHFAAGRMKFNDDGQSVLYTAPAEKAGEGAAQIREAAAGNMEQRVRASRYSGTGLGQYGKRNNG